MSSKMTIFFLCYQITLLSKIYLDTVLEVYYEAAAISCPIWMPVQDLVALLPIQLHASVHGKAVKNSLTVWVPIPLWETCAVSQTLSFSLAQPCHCNHLGSEQVVTRLFWSRG